MSRGFTVTGIANVMSKLETRKQRVIKGVNDSISEALDSMLDKSLLLVPRDTGNLANTAFVVGTAYSGNYDLHSTNMFSNKHGDMYEISTSYAEAVHEYGSLTGSDKVNSNFYAGYGGYYAVQQHESPYKHKIGQWKYLQTAFQSSVFDIYDKITFRIQGVING